MANRQRRIVEVGASRVTAAPGSVGPGPDAGVQVALAASRMFGQIAERVGGMADKAAVREGRVAGGVEGGKADYRPYRDGTLYGDAYDAAGIETYRSRMAHEVTGQIEGLVEKHPANPAKLGEELAALREGWKSRVFEEVQPDFEALWTRQSMAAVKSATRHRAAKVRSEQRGALETELTTRLRSLEQMAWRAGMGADADMLLAAEIGSLTKRLTVVGPDGDRLVAPEAAAKILAGAHTSVARVRIAGAFAELPDVPAKAAYIEDLRERYKKGGDATLDLFAPDEMERIVSGLEGDVRSGAASVRTGVRMIEREVKDFERLAEKGFMPREEDLAGLKAKVLSTGDPELAVALDRAVSTAGVVTSLARMPPAEVEARIAAERVRIGEAPSLVAVERIELADRLLDKMRTELKTDPLSWAERAGLVSVPPLALGGEGAAASLKARAAAAETVASSYGVPARYFRPEEARALGRLMGEGGDRTIALAATLVDGLGAEAAPTALAELGDHAPVAATIGALALAGGDEMAIRDAAAGLALRRIEGHKSLLPPPKRVATVMGSTFDDTLRHLPAGAAARIRDTGLAIYEARAAKAGATEIDDDMLAQAMVAAAGYRPDGFGGIGRSSKGWLWGTSGRQVLLPSWLSTDGFPEVVGALVPEDLAKAGPHDGGGRALPLDVLERVSWVTVGDGVYAAALGDPDGDDPQWLMSADGENRFVLDLGALRPALRKRRPDIVR